MLSCCIVLCVQAQRVTLCGAGGCGLLGLRAVAKSAVANPHSPLVKQVRMPSIHSRTSSRLCSALIPRRPQAQVTFNHPLVLAQSTGAPVTNNVAPLQHLTTHRTLQ